jgi:ribosome-associated toxin RatA of RatAB toxin-antitoxin module
MRRFRARTFIRRDPRAVFDFIADYRNVPRVLEGVSRWEPIGRKTRGVGARYRVEMRTLGIPLGAVLRLDGWRRPEQISWMSEDGLISQSGGWTFTPREDGVELELEMAYSPPAAALGDLVAGRVEGLVKRRLSKALERIRTELEAS